jgi:hypothetical protein
LIVRNFLALGQQVGQQGMDYLRRSNIGMNSGNGLLLAKN